MHREDAYANDVLVSAAWVADRLDTVRGDDPSLRLVEVDLTTEFYQQGHVPGAVNVVWSANLEASGLFKPREDLEELYRRHGVTDDRSVIVYYRIGERSSLTWFVLSELLGFGSVQNYDGSWTEWGSMVGVPIATGREETTAPAPGSSRPYQ
jgi:3-mercaptopyruvate sulfurtransferase SseA